MSNEHILNQQNQVDEKTFCARSTTKFFVGYRRVRPIRQDCPAAKVNSVDVVVEGAASRAEARKIADEFLAAERAKGGLICVGID